MTLSSRSWCCPLLLSFEKCLSCQPQHLQCIWKTNRQRTWETRISKMAAPVSRRSGNRSSDLGASSAISIPGTDPLAPATRNSMEIRRLMQHKIHTICGNMPYMQEPAKDACIHACRICHVMPETRDCARTAHAKTRASAKTCTAKCPQNGPPNLTRTAPGLQCYARSYARRLVQVPMLCTANFYVL